MDGLTMNQPVLQDVALLNTLDDPMDDLFGDAADTLVASLPPIPLPAPIILRLTQMRRTGCCTSLTWANTGSIIAISDDGRQIQFRTMMRNQIKGEWALSEPSREHLVAPTGKHFVHLQTNGVGVDLAAVDDSGGVHLYTLVGALSKMQLAPSERTDDGSGRAGIDTVVGLHWLALYPQEFKSPIITSAHKNQGKWSTRIRNRDQSAAKVHHPADNRNALLYITSAGHLTLLYQSEINSWQSVSTDLSSFTSAENLLTHASMGEHGDSLLLATHDAAAHLSLYKVSINWNATPHTQGNVTIMSVAPVLSIGHLAALERLCPQVSDAAKLTHLRVLGTTTDGVEDNRPILPTILAVFSHAVSALDLSPQVQDSFSVLGLWQVDTVTPQLHESFTKLKSGSAAPNQASVTYLKRQPDIILNKIILSVDMHAWNSIVALTASDGTVSFRDRSTFSIIESFDDATETVSSLPQSGLEHMPIKHQPIVALSTDGSALVYKQTDGKMATKMITLRYGWQTSDDGLGSSQASVEAAVVCLARQYSLLCYSSVSNDEPIALLPSDASAEKKKTFVQQIIRMTVGKPDVAFYEQSRQQLAVLRDPFIQRALSAQLVLGTRPNGQGRDWSGQMAYAVLNLKLIGNAFLNTMGQRSQDVKRPDSAAYQCGSARWSTELMIYIMSSILPLRRPEPGRTPRQSFEQSVRDTQNPSIHLLLCATSRALLRYHLMFMPNYQRLATMAVPHVQSVHERQQLISILEMMNSLPFSSYKPLLALVNELDAAVRDAYSKSGVTAERRYEIEISLLTDPTIPEELAPALQALTDTILPNIGEAADLNKLFFWSPKTLDMTNASPAKSANRKPIIDAITKVPLTPELRLRVCRRCGAQTQDLTPEQIRSLPMWLSHAQRHCYCLNYWWLP